MERQEIIVRPARREDAPIIAEAVAMAVGYDTSHPLYAVFLELAGREVAQYSYRNSLVAEVDGAVAGAIVGYDGARLEELRAPIYPLLKEHLGEVPHIEDETEAGEYYLDSLGVLPAYRGLSVGTALLNAATERAFAEGHTRVGLIVDFDNPNAERLYSSLGFQRVGEKRFLGHRMWHLQRQRPSLKRIKITVKRITEYRDLMAEYENPIEHTCDMRLGQCFVVENCEKPEGMCQSAWETLYPFVRELAEGGGNFFDGWMRNPHSAMLSCNDGFRPVSFYVEVVDNI